MFKVEVPDIDYFKRLVSCQNGCPVLTDARGYVQAISDGRYEDAYLIARNPNPFASICGRICNAPCETACRRGSIDEPIAIRPLKRFVCERFGVESTHPASFAKSLNSINQKVAIIGAGPCGLSCAHELALLGYKPTVFEAQSKPGGMLLLGVPEYRLPRKILEKEADAIFSLEVEFKPNMRLGADFSIQDLRRDGYQAIFLAIGACRARSLSIEGMNLDGVFNAIDFLLNVNLGYKIDIGKKVVVVGGGSVAFDAARSALRGIKDIDVMSADELKMALEETRQALSLVTEKAGLGEDGIKIAMDVARQAMRLGVRDVNVYCLESKEEMPADKADVEEAIKEGIKLYPRFGPKRIIGKSGKAAGLELIAVKSVFDNEGRFNPVFLDGTEKIVEADTVIMAIGQAPDLSFIQPQDNIKISRRGTIEIDGTTLMTYCSGIFAGGDVVYGPRIVIEAVRDGKRAALSIHKYLTQKPIDAQQPELKWHIIREHHMYENYDKIKKCYPPTLPIERRIGINEVELAYPERDANLESLRCLKCDIATIFDGEKCILCGGCVDVCPSRCLRLVDVNSISFDGNLPQGIKTAMLKDETKCIRCGLCAARCPTGAVTMERFEESSVTG